MTKTCTPSKNTAQVHYKTRAYSTDTNAQQQRLLRALEQAGAKGVTSIEARHTLDIIHAPARVYELRHKQGKNIRTEWAIEINPCGGEHRIARYVLLNGKHKEVA